jgi:hypothetical protein
MSPERKQAVKDAEQGTVDECIQMVLTMYSCTPSNQDLVTRAQQLTYEELRPEDQRDVGATQSKYAMSRPDALTLWYIRQEGLATFDKRLCELVQRELAASAPRTPQSPVYPPEEASYDVVLCGIYPGPNAKASPRTESRTSPRQEEAMLENNPSVEATAAQALAVSPPYEPLLPESFPNAVPAPSLHPEPLTEVHAPDTDARPVREPIAEGHKHGKRKKRRPDGSTPSAKTGTKAKRHKGVIYVPMSLC